jgi:hypothetical protein
MKLMFDRAKWSIDMEGSWLMLKVDSKEAAQFCEEEMKQGEKYSAELKKHRNRRSLDANAYFWVLCGKLAAKVGVPKDEVYRCLIKDVGDNYVIVPIKNEAVDKWIENWQSKGLGWVCDILGESKLDGYTNVVTYYASSTYDTKQMSTLINLIVEECKLQGIDTMTPQELSLLLEGWK